ncbi:xanthine dehydrogenase family protein subunit M [Streptomyces sp. NPDC005438]|uniref:FAD binding domain-containing protein n=1 Tax=Streptomyces sp. NPDC005438 TaxID=3156880 RepID=UPI0033AD7C54
MEFLRPGSWPEALAAKAEYPEALPLAGGTDVMVELNFDQRRPPQLLDLGRVAELAEWEEDGDAVRLGATVPYTRVIGELADPLPALALASRTVGSPQIRNRGTVGGNLGAASPAGDCHPALLAAGSEVEVESVRGSRLIPVEEFFTGVKRHALAEDELIRAVRVRRATGPQQFSKVGTRNAMVIAVCAFAVALRPDERSVRAGIGSAAPTPVRAREAEEFLAGALEEQDAWHRLDPLPDSLVRRFGELAARDCRPIDDVRGSADYRRHAVSVMARRTLGWTWDAYRQGERQCV